MRLYGFITGSNQRSLTMAGYVPIDGYNQNESDERWFDLHCHLDIRSLGELGSAKKLIARKRYTGLEVFRGISLPTATA